MARSCSGHGRPDVGGWLYLAAVLDLNIRRIVGWSMQPTLTHDIVLDALLMAVWRRKPCPPLIVHSDEGS